MKTVYALWMLLLSRIGVSAVGYIPRRVCIPPFKVSRALGGASHGTDRVSSWAARTSSPSAKYGNKMQQSNDASPTKKRWLDKIRKKLPRAMAFLRRFFTAAEVPFYMVFSGLFMLLATERNRRYFVLLKEYTTAVGGCVSKELCAAIERSKQLGMVGKYAFCYIVLAAAWDFIRNWRRSTHEHNDKDEGNKVVTDAY